MLLETIIELLIWLPELIISLIPDLEIEIPENLLSGISNIVDITGYLFPISALLPIIFLFIGIDVAQIVVAIILRIKSFIPTRDLQNLFSFSLKTLSTNTYGKFSSL